MKLTKEECENAVNDLDYSLCELEELKTEVDVSCIYNASLEIFKQLITEHFDNPPLTLEEIKKMITENQNRKLTVFDSQEKCYIELFVNYKGFIDFFCFGDECEEEFVFEENRFYESEVKENETN